MPSLKPFTSCLTGSPMLKLYAIESGKKSNNKLKQKSASSLDDPPSLPNPLTTVGADSRPVGSPSWCTTLKVVPASPMAKGKQRDKDVTPTSMSLELHSRGGVMSPPQHMEKLLYDEDRCTCDLEWHCVPHNACFIHDLCFCEGSGSFPPVKPPHPSWSNFSYKWYCELASHLELHPHSPLPRFGSEVEYLPLVMPYYRVPPPC